MDRPARSLPAALVIAALAAAPTLVPPPAQAVPVFGVSEVTPGGSLVDQSSVPCTRVVTTSAPMSAFPVVENGPGTAAAASISGSLTHDGDPSDVMTLAARIEATGSVASVGGNPRSVRLDATGNVAVSTTKGTSLCTAEIVSRVALRSEFTVSQGGFLTLTTTASPDSSVYADVEDHLNEERFLAVVSQGSKIDGPIRVFLPPGSYETDFQVGAWANTSVAVGPTPVSVSIRGDFTVAGSQLAAQPGKAGRYVVLPSARTCAAHLLLPTITDRKKRVRQVKQVSFFVNGTRVKTVRTPGRGAQLPLPVADGARVHLRSELVLFPARRGRPAKHLVATASYEACS